MHHSGGTLNIEPTAEVTALVEELCAEMNHVLQRTVGHVDFPFDVRVEKVQQETVIVVRAGGGIVSS